MLAVHAPPAQKRLGPSSQDRGCPGCSLEMLGRLSPPPVCLPIGRALEVLRSLAVVIQASPHCSETGHELRSDRSFVTYRLSDHILNLSFLFCKSEDGRPSSLMSQKETPRA